METADCCVRSQQKNATRKDSSSRKEKDPASVLKDAKRLATRALCSSQHLRQNVNHSDVIAKLSTVFAASNCSSADCFTRLAVLSSHLALTVVSMYADTIIDTRLCSRRSLALISRTAAATKRTQSRVLPCVNLLFSRRRSYIRHHLIRQRSHDQHSMT